MEFVDHASESNYQQPKIKQKHFSLHYTVVVISYDVKQMPPTQFGIVFYNYRLNFVLIKMKQSRNITTNDLRFNWSKRNDILRSKIVMLASK